MSLMKFTNADDIYTKGMKYINKVLANNEHLTFTGLCIALGTCRDTLNEYCKGVYDTDTQVYSDSVKRLKVHVENYAEGRLFENNCTGAIFALKNYGWHDKTEVENTGELKVKTLDMSQFTVEQLKEMAREDGE